MTNTFFINNDLSFTSKLRTFIRDNKYGYYLDIFIPEKYITKLMINGVQPQYINEGLESGFVLRCRLYSSSIVIVNGRRLQYLSDELSSSALVPNNTKISVLELSGHPITKKKRTYDDAQVTILRAAFKTKAQKLPQNFDFEK